MKTANKNQEGKMKLTEQQKQRISASLGQEPFADGLAKIIDHVNEYLNEELEDLADGVLTSSESEALMVGYDADLTECEKAMDFWQDVREHVFRTAILPHLSA